MHKLAILKLEWIGSDNDFMCMVSVIKYMYLNKVLVDETVTFNE